MDHIGQPSRVSIEDDLETEDWSAEFATVLPGPSDVYGCDEQRLSSSFGAFSDLGTQKAIQQDMDNVELDKLPHTDVQKKSVGQATIPVNRMALNDHKAGMGGLDKDKINRIIYETSKGSLFYENEQKKEERVKERIAKFKKALGELTDVQKLSALKEADAEVEKLEKCRDLSRTIVHIDMDAFYAAVEMRDNPELKHKPMAVGGMGMLSTSNYVARSYGVRAGMPGFIGKKLCPDLIMIPPHFDKYRAVSEQVKEVLVNYDPNFSMGSMDEAYLDITEYLKNLNKGTPGIGIEKRKTDSISEVASQYNKEDSYDIASLETAQAEATDVNLTLAELVVKQLRNEIFEKTSLTASAGIAPNTMLAKICSDKNKPNGQYYLQPYRSIVLNFIRALPIRKVFGIGRVSEQVLNSLGIMTCQDIFDNRAILKILFSPISFDSFLHISLGISSNLVSNDADRKSISTETTFGKIGEPKELLAMCDNLCKLLAKDVASEQIQGKTVTIKFKLVNFETRSRAKSLSSPVSTYEDIHRVARDILLHEIQAVKPKPLELRLMGVRLSELSNTKGQDQNKIEFFLKKKDPATQQQTVDENRSKDSSTIGNNIGIASMKTTKQSQTMPSISTMFSKQMEKSTPKSIPSDEEMVECPICGLKVPLSVDINVHIDLCLNVKAIDELNEDKRTTVSESETKFARKRKRAPDNDSNSSSKQTSLKSFYK